MTSANLDPLTYSLFTRKSGQVNVNSAAGILLPSSKSPTNAYWYATLRGMFQTCKSRPSSFYLWAINQIQKVGPRGALTPQGPNLQGTNAMNEPWTDARNPGFRFIRLLCARTLRFLDTFAVCESVIPSPLMPHSLRGRCVCN